MRVMEKSGFLVYLLEYSRKTENAQMPSETGSPEVLWGIWSSASVRCLLLWAGRWEVGHGNCLVACMLLIVLGQGGGYIGWVKCCNPGGDDRKVGSHHLNCSLHAVESQLCLKHSDRIVTYSCMQFYLDNRFVVALLLTWECAAEVTLLAFITCINVQRERTGFRLQAKTSELILYILEAQIPQEQQIGSN